ncbi:MAG: PadR family transcriptional regulator [Peptococcaceae bacterium]|nr:PadR family transcriptional regulator [Peptococcaceae bacterium]
MLSNIEVVLLSIVNEKPSYAYEIDKTINCRDMRRWVRVGVASIYQVLKRLEEKDLVYSEKEKEGSMPDRKRYYITDSGKVALVEASKRLLSDLEWYYLDLNVGLETSDLLTTEEVAGCLKKRLAGVQSNKKRLKELYSADNDMVFKKKAVIRTLIYFREAEEKFLKEVLQELSSKERGHTC